MSPEWIDDSNQTGMHANIRYSYTASYAAITLTAGSVWGRAFGPSYLGLTYNVATYPVLEINVNSITAGATWKMGLWRNGAPWDYHELNMSNTITGVFDYNYPLITGWSGTVSFFIQLVVEGLPGSALVVDWIKVYNP